MKRRRSCWASVFSPVIITGCNISWSFSGWWNRSLWCTNPMILSMVSLYIRMRDSEVSMNVSVNSSMEVCTLRPTNSVRGTMISRTSTSENSRAFRKASVSISCASMSLELSILEMNSSRSTLENTLVCVVLSVCVKSESKVVEAPLVKAMRGHKRICANRKGATKTNNKVSACSRKMVLGMYSAVMSTIIVLKIVVRIKLARAFEKRKER